MSTGTDIDDVESWRGTFGDGYVGKELTLWRGRPSVWLALRYWLVGFLILIVLKLSVVAAFLATLGTNIMALIPFFAAIPAGTAMIVTYGVTLGIPLILSIRLLFISYEITNQRVVRKSGVLSRAIQMVELYRVRDLDVYLPFSQRILGVGAVRIYSTDHTLPELHLVGQPHAEKIWNLIRKQVKMSKTKAGVRVLESVDVGMS